MRHAPVRTGMERTETAGAETAPDRAESARVQTLHLSPTQRLDDLQIGGLRLIQDTKYFCYGIDAVLLSDFAKAGRKDRVIDLCTGSGVVALLMSAKTEAAHLTGLELQAEQARMAEESVRFNGLEDRIDIIQGDVREAGTLFAPASFDVVTCNPPYKKAGSGLVNPEGALAIARHEVTLTFADVAEAAARLLRHGGHFYLVHRPQRLNELMGMLTARNLEPKTLRFVHPYRDAEANLVLIECIKGANSFLRVLPPLAVYREKYVYTPEIRRIYGLLEEEEGL